MFVPTGSVPALASDASVVSSRSRLGSLQLGSLAILASTSTGEVADFTIALADDTSSATLLRSRSARHV